MRSGVLLSSCPLRSPAPAIRGYWRGKITALGLLAPVQSSVSKLLLRQYTHPNPFLPSSAPRRSRYFSHTLSNVRVGFLQQSSKSPQSSSICNHTLARGDLLDSRFPNNVVSFSRNVVLRDHLFLLNSVSKPRMLSVRAVYVLSPLQLRSDLK